MIVQHDPPVYETLLVHRNNSSKLKNKDQRVASSSGKKHRWIPVAFVASLILVMLTIGLAVGLSGKRDKPSGETSAVTR